MKSITYFATIIFLALNFSSCQKATPTPASGTGANDFWQKDDLSGTRWRMYQYKLDGSSNIFATSDTLVFTSPTNYTYNGHSFSYYLAKTTQNGVSYMLNLGDTPFGTISGYPPSEFKTYGVMNGIKFSGYVSGVNQAYDMWFQQI